MFIRAAQYVRMSTDQQPLSISLQKQSISAYAEAHGIEIIATYEDEAKSGLSLTDRSGMQRLLRDVMEAECPFTKILVLDVTRWGRFQDVDESAYHEYHCRKNGVQVVYVGEPFPENASPMDSVIKQLKRVMAAEFSREMAVKISAAQERAARQGFKSGGTPLLGYVRQAVAADGTPKGILRRGERKPLLTDRVRCVLGSTEEVDLVRRIFELFTHSFLTAGGIADLLNAEGHTTAIGTPFAASSLLHLVKSELYYGVYVYGASRKRSGYRSLVKPRAPLRITGLVEPIIDEETWRTAQWAVTHRPRVFHPTPRTRPSAEGLLTMLREAVEKNPTLGAESLRSFGLPAANVFRNCFGTFASAREALGEVWNPHAGEWHERRLQGMRLVRAFYRDVATLIEERGISCRRDHVRCILHLATVDVKVKAAWRIPLGVAEAWRNKGTAWVSGWMLLMLLNEDATGREFYLVPPEVCARLPRILRPKFLEKLSQWRSSDREGLAHQLLSLSERATHAPVDLSHLGPRRQGRSPI